MKNIRATVENIWMEVRTVILTEEQLTIRYSQKEEDKEKRLALSEMIKQQSEVPINGEEKEVVSAIYESNKPVLKEGDEYQFIDCVIAIDGSNALVHGLLNCRVNEDQIQIRF